MRLPISFCPGDEGRVHHNRWLLAALPRGEIGGHETRPTRAWRAWALLPLCLLLTSCPAIRDGHALGVLAPVAVPAEVVGRFFVVEAAFGPHGVFRFLLDSGSTLSLLSPRLAQFARRDAESLVTTRTAEGDRVQLERVTIPHLSLGDATFVELPAGVHGFDDLSHQLGVTIDGVLGISAFRDVLLTLDYPARLLRLDPHGKLDRSNAATRAAYFGAGVPLAAVRVGGREVMALIDSGSDGALAIDSSVGVPLTTAPREGGLRATLAGDRTSLISRAAGDLQLGPHLVSRPMVELTSGIPAVGGEVLAGFAVSFDQRHSLIAFERDTAAENRVQSRRSLGLSFVRAADHWRVAAVIPDTPATSSDVAVGDECVRIDGEAVGAWPIDRFEAELRTRETVTLSFRSSGGLRDVSFPVVDLIP